MIPRRPPKPPDPNAALRRHAALRKLAQALRSRIALPGQAMGQTARDPRVDQLLQNEQQKAAHEALPVKPPWKNQ
jgi:hypothetical protein